MAQEDREVARRAAETLAAGDFDGWLALHSADCEFTPHIVRAEAGEPYRGHAGCRAFWNDIHSAFVEWRPQVEEVTDVGDAVLVELQLRGVGTDSRVPVAQRVWQVLKVRDGKTTWWRIYTTKAEALAAVELSE